VSRRSGRRGTRSWVVIGRGGGGPSVPEAPRSNRSVGRSVESIGRSVGRIDRSVGRSVESIGRSVGRIDRSVGRSVEGWMDGMEWMHDGASFRD
jgi:hypothetical protein